MLLNLRVARAQNSVVQPEENTASEGLSFKGALPASDDQNDETLEYEGDVEEEILSDEPEFEESAEGEVEENSEIVDENDVEDDAQGEKEPEPIVKKPVVVNMSQLITLDLRGMDVNDALTYISLRSGANIVSSKAVTGRVTLQLKDVPLQDVFDITLLTNNLAYEKFGNIFYIMTEAEYEARYGKKFSDTRQVKMIQLQYAIPEKAFDLLDTLKSSIGRILVDQQSGAVLMVDTGKRIEEMIAALANLEKKGEVKVFDLQYAMAEDVEERLRSQLDDSKVGSIWSDQRNNQVVVRALPDRMTDVKDIIAALDKKTLEVLIDTKIIKVKMADSMTTGFEWEGMFEQLLTNAGGGFLGTHPIESAKRTGEVFIDSLNQNNSTSVAGISGAAATSVSNYPFLANTDSNLPAGSKKVFGEELFFGSTNTNSSFEVLMKFLATLGETRLLSNPKIAVVNNQEARIHVGRQEAYITATTTAGQTTTTTAEDVTFVDVGIQLSVTPTINDDGYITMKIKPEVSSVVDVLITPSGNQIPIIDTSLAETTVMVKDNSTIIIGGLRRDEESSSARRIPFLGDLPFFGSIFRSQTNATERSELLVMITPHIVDGNIVFTGDVDDPGNEATKTYKDYQTFDSMLDAYGPEFEPIEYKSFRD
jgi:type IV pilus assembly protein PilQ